MRKHHMEKRDIKEDELIVELSENELDSMLAPLIDGGMGGGAMSRSKISRAMGAPIGRDAPFPCFKRSSDSDQFIVRITPEY